MPLDPQLQTFVDQVNLLDIPPTSVQTPDEIRRTFALYSSVSPSADGVDMVEREIPGPAGPLPVRVYAPAGDPGDGGRAGLVYFHGGGHVFGGVATHDGPTSILAAAADVVVVSVEYRLAPEDLFPADVEDADAAVAFVADHAGEFGIDPRRLAVGGDSAGGNLATVAARHARDGAGGGRPALAAQLLLYPWVDLTCDRPSMSENAKGYVLRRDDLEHWRTLYVPDEAQYRHPDASAIYAEDFTGLPPAVVVTAGFDPLRDQGDAYAAKLAAAGVPVRHLQLPDMIHTFVQLTAISEGAAAATDNVGRELASLLEL